MRVRRRVDVVAKGGTWEDAVSDDMVDATNVEGLIVLRDAPDVLTGPHAFVGMLAQMVGEREVDGRIECGTLDALFPAAIRSPHGVLMFLGEDSQHVFFHRRFPPTPTPELIQARHQPFVSAAAEHWAALVGVGPRYSIGLPEGQSLWSFRSNLSTALHYLGITRQDLAASIPRGGLPTLLRERAH
jgi:hypothetical protein